MYVKVRHCLSGSGAVVNTDIEAVWLVICEEVLCAFQSLAHLFALGFGKLEEGLDMAFRKNERMPAGNRVSVPDCHD